MDNQLQALESLYQRGTELFMSGCYADAYQHYLQCNDIRPVTGEVLNALGLTAFMLKQFDRSAIWFEALLRLAPGATEPRLNLGSALFELGQFDAALESYDAVIAADPQNAQAFYNRGVVLRNLKRLDESQVSYEKAIELRPDYAEAYSNLGVVYHERAQPDKALRCYERARAIKPDYAEAFSNAGATYMALADYDASLAAYQNAISLQPNLPSACWNKGILLLLRGNFEEGLPLYEWRFHHQRQALFRRPLSLDTPRLAATDDINGKTVFLYDEQGLGDTIQMARYIPFLAAKGAKVILRAASELHGLFGQLEGLAALQGDFDEPLPHQFQCPLMSLPLATATRLQSIPANVPYLKADPQKQRRFREMLNAYGLSTHGSTGNAIKKSFGLVWAGNPRNPTDARRSIPLSTLLPMLPRMSGQEGLYISFQKGASEQDKALLATRSDVLDLSDKLDDFTDTAALCACMDLMVCVDTSVAHLAGALGVPTVLMIACVPDWRWMLGREDTPWYPGMRLLRQPQPGDWHSVLDRLQTLVQELKRQ